MSLLPSVPQITRPSKLSVKGGTITGKPLNKLLIEQRGPIIVYGDNVAAIMMANTSKPNGRIRQIDISHFAIQEWVEKGYIKLTHICGVASPLDSLTKALGWTLSCCHVKNMMEHDESKYKHWVFPLQKLMSLDFWRNLQISCWKVHL